MTKEPWQKELEKHDPSNDGKLQSAREALRQAQASVVAASIASCDCNTKTDNPVYHAAHCRWLKLITAMDSLDSVAEYLA